MSPAHHAGDVAAAVGGGGWPDLPPFPPIPPIPPVAAGEALGATALLVEAVQSGHPATIAIVAVCYVFGLYLRVQLERAKSTTPRRRPRRRRSDSS